jgi:hypothetical protein
MIEKNENAEPIRGWPKKANRSFDDLRGEVGRLELDEHVFLETRDAEDLAKGFAYNELWLWGEMTAACIRRIEEILVEDEEEGIENLDEVKAEAHDWLVHIGKLAGEAAGRS